MNAQQLKNSILQLAVQGKLVPQNPNDEPASELLKRIKAEKEKLIKEKKIKPDKNPSEIFRGSDNLPYEKVGKNEPVCIADEVPFDIPDSWEWVRLGSILLKLTDGTHSTPKYVNNGIPFLSVKDISNGYIDFSDTKYISESEHKELYKRCNPEFGDLLLTKVGTTGIPVIVETEQEFSLFVSVALLKFNQDLLFNKYLKFLILSPLVQFQAQENTKGVGNKNWVMRDIFNTLIPLPPLSEQQRIVEKIEELLPLVEEYDKVEKQNKELNISFPEKLKKSILQEAVQGKLVPQDPNDEPASVLIDRIRKEKEQLIKDKKIKKDKNESYIFRRDNSYYEKFENREVCIDDEIPFDIPDNWEWTRLGNILLKLTDGTHSTPKYTQEGVPFLSVKDISGGVIDFSDTKFISENEHKELFARCNPEFGDILLTKVGTTGIPVVVNTEKEFSLFVSVALLKFNQTLLYNNYLKYLILSPLVQIQAAENTKGVGNKNWVMRDIAKTLIVIPPLKEQFRIVEKLNTILKFIDKLNP